MAFELRELPILHQEIKARAACVGLLVGPFVHAEFAIDEEFLALLNELAKILGRSTPYFEIDKSSDLLFLPLSVGDRTAFPLGVYRSSGSAVRLPVMMILLTFITVT